MADVLPPYGGALVDREPKGAERRALLAAALRLPGVTIGPEAHAWLQALATGALSPLSGFMDAETCRAVLCEHALPGPRRLPWPATVLLPVRAGEAHGLAPGACVALRDERGACVGLLELSEVFRPDPRWWREAGCVAPPWAGPARETVCLAGPAWLLARLEAAEPAYEADPADVRAALGSRGWRRVVAFFTGDVLHRDAEYLLRTLLETADGAVVWALAGARPPLSVRLKAAEALLRRYFPAGRVLLHATGTPNLRGSPRAAVLAAIVAQNHGCTHLAVHPELRGAPDAALAPGGEERLEATEEAFLAASGLGVEPVFLLQPVHCDACGGMVTDRTCPHGPPDRVMMSRERLLRLLAAGIRPPAQYTRPEVAEILSAWARGA